MFVVLWAYTTCSVRCREALQSLISPSDALLAMCSSAAYGVKEGIGEHSKKLPAEVELDRLASKWGVSTGAFIPENYMQA